jgi:predicted ferric reductase/acylphosphatase/tRNA A37 threonylcarbamoyladenosine synthetase subunit TsaC/SUA5/YrdC
LKKSQRWVVTGVVQGVGFRPWIWQVAHQLGIKGAVCNTADGAQIDLYQPTSAQCDAFRHALSSPPPLCRIDSITVHPIVLSEAVGFEIQTSQTGDPHAGVPADAATCQACLDEMNDPTNRRYQYPFINCTHCGPRLSIIQSIPYDRASTTMAAFEQCDACLAEYSNPADRRFHAQPNACPVCGPTVWICDQEGEPVSTQDWLSLTVDALEQGQIVAIKGVGGFHLCCDATQPEAIKRLRRLKHRPDKPLAVMFASRSALSETPSVKALSPDAQSLLWDTLQSPIAPVVLVPWKPASQHDGQHANDIAFNELASRQHRLGVILPYSPIHHLVMQAFQRPLVMTSGNRSGFPQAITKGTKWMVGWGWLDRPQRGGRPPEETLSSLEQFMRNQRGLAETVGEWAFYIVVAFIAIALIKRIPYSFFRSTHRWIGLIYLGLVIHAVILVKTDYWTQPIGIVLAALLVGGTFSAFLSLFRQIGSRQKVRGTLSSLHHHGDMIEANVQVSSGWPGHTPGQFAFVTSNATEGPHPYTIASAWNPGSEVLTFVIKQLGDWTQQLPHYLKTGMPISIEGPYGCFDFKDDAKTQIWIAGGVGITPFMAKLESLAQESTSRLKKVTLLYSLQSDNPAMIERVRALAVEANVPVNVKISDKEGRFSQEDLLGALTDPADTSVWFCGPDAFGKTVQKTYEKAGIKRGRIHKELFEMR